MTKRKKDKKEIKEQKEGAQENPSVKIDRHGIVSLVVFLFAISMVLISTTSLIFPALIVDSSSDIKLAELGIRGVPVNTFELGPAAYPIFLANGIVFVLAFLHFKNKLGYLSKLFRFVFEYEVSKKVAIITLVVILAVYVAANAQELAEEEKWADYAETKARAGAWPGRDQTTPLLEPHMNYFFIKSSVFLFGSYAVIPFLASIAIVVITYLLTQKITGKRFAGLVSAVILLQSSLFLTFDTSVAYSNFWILFYLLSLYFALVKWPLSPASFLATIPAKAIMVLYFPMLVYFVFRSNIKKRSKLVILGVVIAVIIPGAAFANITYGFDSAEFWAGFISAANHLRFDGLVSMFMIPLTVGLFLSSKVNKHSESIMFLLGGLLLVNPLVTGFTDQTNQPYRFIPFIVFFAIGVGVLLSKRAKSV